MHILKNVVVPLVICIILLIAGFIIEGMYAPPAGPYINTLSGLCFSLIGIIGTATLILNLPKQQYPEQERNSATHDRVPLPPRLSSND
jgi:hypothetical protein